MSDSSGRVSCHPNFVKYLEKDTYVNRDDASAILEYVGVNSPAGIYPCEIPPYILGRAIRRLVFNFFTNEEGNQDANTISREFLCGFNGQVL